VWCGIVRHRLRLCFAAFIASQRSGSTPLILLARPTAAGERVWVWLRTGLAISDLENRLDRLATGCWAAECRVVPASSRYAALVRLDITRRNPLRGLVGSPLPGLVPTVTDASTGSPVRAPKGLDLPDVTDPDTPPPAVGPRRPAITAVPAQRDPVVSELLSDNGEDLSAYI
jgi:hypothetical protein